MNLVSCAFNARLISNEIARNSLFERSSLVSARFRDKSTVLVNFFSPLIDNQAFDPSQSCPKVMIVRTSYIDLLYG